MGPSNQLAVHIPTEVALPDNSQWQNRFKITSETSDRIYVISQNKGKKYWGCSCPSWRVRRTCKHLEALGLPGYERPYEPKIERGQ